MKHDTICEIKMRKKDVVEIVTFDLIGLLPTNNIIGIPEFVLNRSMLTVK